MCRPGDLACDKQAESPYRSNPDLFFSPEPRFSFVIVLAGRVLAGMFAQREFSKKTPVPCGDRGSSFIYFFRRWTTK